MLHVDITFIGVVQRYQCDRDPASRMCNFPKLSKFVRAFAGVVRGDSKRAFSGVVRGKGLICCSVHDVQSMRIASYLIFLSFFLSEVTLALNLSACI